jgi:glutamate dehydrogenase/leucine dehydrogenase
MVNAGGLLSVIDQYEHGVASEERIMDAVKKIPERIYQTIKKSNEHKQSIGLFAENDAIARLWI